MTRIVYTFLIAIILTSCILAQNIYDDAEHSGDYESELAVTQITFKENKKQPTSPVRATVAPRKTKATTTAAKASTTTRPPQKKTDLQSDLNDFLELIPTDDIKEKFDEYYRNDMDIQHIYEYLSSKEFYELRKYVLDMQDVKEVLQYLHRKGFNVKLLVRKVGHRLGFNKMKLQRQTSHEAGNLGTNTTIGGLNGLVEDILAVLPQDEIFVLFFEKLDKSTAFNTFVESIGNPEFARKYNVLWSSKELHSVTAQLKKHKIDVGKIIQILRNYFFFGAL